MDLKSVNLGQRIAAGGGVLLFVFLFVGWYTVGGTIGDIAGRLGVDVSMSGWEAHTVLRWLLLLTIVAAVGLAVLSAMKRPIAELPGSAIVAGLGIVATAITAFRMFVDQPGPDKLIDLKFGAWFGLIGLVAITVGGWMSMHEEGTSVHAAAEQLRRAFQRTHHEPPGAPTS